MFGFTFKRRIGAIIIAAGFAIMSLPPAASAQDQDVPSYARPSYASADETIHGRIRSVEGAFTISVDDDRGFVDNVELHQGTIINPTGLTLSPGMSVTILGENAGSAFSANEIDTPYTYAGPLPTPVYYGPGYWCPGFAYGYGPSFSLAIIIGGGVRPWYYEHRPYYGRPWNGHAYFGASIAFAAQDRRGEGPRRYPSAGSPALTRGSFAGEQRADPDRFGTESTARSPGTRYAPQQMRGARPEARANQAAGYSRSPGGNGNYSRGPGEYARGVGSARASGPSRGGGEHASGGHSGGHAH